MSSEARHTPGPWRPYPESSREWCVEAESKGIACAEAEADARLIAAAPELLEAAKEATEQLTQLGVLPHAHEKLYWAIAKAEGVS